MLARWPLARWPLLAAMALWVPLALETTPFRLRLPTWPVQVALGAVALVLLLRTPLDPARRAPPAPRALALRSVLGAVALGAATWVHVLAGGGALFVPKFLFVGAATVLGLLLGPLAVFEHHAASRQPSRRTDALAALLAGWGAFLGLAVGWVQARYVAEVVRSGQAEAMLEEALAGAWWLAEDPGWTLRHYGWALVPGAAFTWARLRGWSTDRQVALGLGVAGATWGLFPGHIPAVTFGLPLLAIGLPVVALVAGLRPAAPLDEPRQERRALAWLAAIVLCGLAAAGLAAREAYRAVRRATLAGVVEREEVRWQEVARTRPLEVDGLADQVAAVHSEALLATTPPRRALVRGRVDLLEAHVGALAARVDLQLDVNRTTEAEVEHLCQEARLNGGHDAYDRLDQRRQELRGAQQTLLLRQAEVAQARRGLGEVRAALGP